MNRLLILLFALFHTPLALAVMDDEPLPPDQAFAFSARVDGADTVIAEWRIADGYYLYQDKLKFSTDTPGVRLGDIALPPGKVKNDEFFGRVTTYRKHLQVEIPLLRDTQGPLTLKLTVQSQGCADIGICYPPQTHTATLELPARAEAAENPPAAIGDMLGLGSGEDELLSADQAFALDHEVRDANTVILRWRIADGYYLYRDKIRVTLKTPGGSTGELTLPPGKIKDDEFFGRMEIYPHDIEARLPLRWDGPAPDTAVLEVGYQGCAEIGICYPPVLKTLSLDLSSTTSGQAAPAATTSLPAPSATTGNARPDTPLTEQDRIAGLLRDSSIWFIVAAFFGFGLLLSFTPCVFPMIPILSSIIVGQGEGLTTRRAFTMSLVYVLAMALTYTAGGVIAGATGANLTAAFQTPWVLISFSLVFVLLSLSMFGFYDLQMPQAIQSRLSEFSNRQQGGTLTGVAIMGFLSALIVGPCVAAPLAGALIFISQTGDAVLGGLALFAMSLGMGAPLLAIGTSAGKFLPRAGDWMNAVKAVFGVLLLAVAVWMLERILPRAITMTLWALLLIVPAVYMGALDPVGRDGSGWRKLWKGLGVAMLAYGVLMLVGVAGGGKDILQPLHGMGFTGATGGTGTTTRQELQFKRIKGLEELDRELAAARGRPVMLDVYADWCISCKELEKYTFSDPSVQAVLKDAVLLKADVTDNDEADKALLKKFQLIGPPAILFFDRNGQERRRHRLVGFLGPEDFVPLARGALRP